MNFQVADMTTNTDIFFQSLEKEFNYLESLQPAKRSTEYWQKLGSSKTRTVEQEKLSREIIEGLIDSRNTENAVGFTDGSCLGNPGTCIAGACLFIPGSVEPIMIKQPVSNRGSILLWELVAIELALNHIYQYKTERQLDIKKIQVFSDSQSAVGQLLLGWEAKSHQTTIHEITRNIFKKDIRRLSNTYNFNTTK